MKILHWLKKENSGLFRTTAELAKYEERAGHTVSLREPSNGNTFYGFADNDFDIHCIHSQLPVHYYKDTRPKLLFLHGEPDYGVLYKISTKAIMDLVPIVDAFITLNEAEGKIWNSFKRTYVIPKGIDLEHYKPIPQDKKLKGSPSVLYAEHWRGFRHPLHTFVAIEKVMKKLPKLLFFPMGCPVSEKDFWTRLIKQNRYSVFTPALSSWDGKIETWLNRADMIVSPVFPSYGRVSLEALACGKPVVAYKTNPHASYKCEPYDPDDMAEKIIQCWEEKPNGQREYAEKYLDAKIMAENAVGIYRRFV